MSQFARGTLAVGGTATAMVWETVGVLLGAQLGKLNMLVALANLAAFTCLCPLPNLLLQLCATRGCSYYKA